MSQARLSLVRETGSLAEPFLRWEAPLDASVPGILNLDPDGNGMAYNENGFTSPVAFNPFSYRRVGDGGRPVASGVYFATLRAGEYRGQGKMLLL